MCNACGFGCCAWDGFSNCGCEDCDCPDCWPHCDNCHLLVDDCICYEDDDCLMGWEDD